MQIHHLRNATFIIESRDLLILIDPMLSDKGELPPFAYFKHQAKRNPTVDLPENTEKILAKVTHCMVTHSQKWGIEPLTHTDHFDRKGCDFLVKNKIPVICLNQDTKYMTKHQIQICAGLEFWQPKNILDGEIIAVPAQHGHGWSRHLMANGAGYFIQLPDEPSIYISGDTVLTDKVEQALTELKPDITVVAAGCASLDIGGPILMPLNEVSSFIEKSPSKVIANHMESLNHCSVSRLDLKQELKKRGLLSKVFIPDDGESFNIS